MAGFHIENFGCRAARADGEAVRAHLRIAGHAERKPSEADVVIVNTCSVTAEADRAARAFIRRSHRRNPDARIVVTGCYAQRAPAELAALPGVSAVVGNSHIAMVPQIILGLENLKNEAGLSQGTISVVPQTLLDMRRALAPADPIAFIPAESLIAPQTAPAPMQWVDDHFAHSFIETPDLTAGSLTRPNLKIQEGCANRCTFCVIPQTRGGSRSLPADSILRKVRSFVAAGGNELVLSGINLGRWGRDLTPAPGIPSNFSALVCTILTDTGLQRLRLSSIEPMDSPCGFVRLRILQRIARYFPGHDKSDTPCPTPSGYSVRDTMISASTDPDLRREVGQKPRSGLCGQQIRANRIRDDKTSPGQHLLIEDGVTLSSNSFCSSALRSGIAATPITFFSLTRP